jgi:tetratricopeptide (TPR) repeat protein/ADP-heptose:LPS heptosyltransferase
MGDASDVFMVSMGSSQQAGVNTEHRNGASGSANEHDNPDVAFLLGVLAMRDGRHEAAIGLLHRAIALGPPKADYHHALAGAYRASGQLDHADGCYREALRLRPGFAEVFNDLGNLHAERGDFDAAITCQRRAVELRPDFAEAHFNLGTILRRRLSFDEAAAAFEAALGAAPEFVEAAKNLGNLRARQGKLEAAIAALRRALEHGPGDFEVHNELGIVLARLRRYAEAEASYREAIRIRPDYPDSHNNLGNALRNQRKLDLALASFREALRLRPAYPEAYNNVGIVLKHLGKLNEAVASYEQALRLRSDYPEAHNNLGLALASRGKLDAAIVSYQQAVRLKPDYVEAYANMADALIGLGRLAEAQAGYKQALSIRPRDARLHKCLGNALARMDKTSEAEASFREAIRLSPRYAEALSDLGIAQTRQGRFDEAIASYRQAIEVKPSFPEAYNNMGNALRNAGRFEESLECYRKALEPKPDYADAHNNLGIAYAELGRFDEAVASYTQCLKIRPNHVDAHMNRALTWLRKGDYAQGWAEYEWRWKKRSLTNRPLIMPQWNGFPLAGRRILLITEQGLGDTLQFVRFCQVLKRQGASSVILECPERLMKVLSRTPGIDELVPQGKPLPEYDVYCALMNVPGLTATSVEAIPADVPYIFPEPELVERWKRELAGGPGLKVGINWQGNPKYAGDRHRSVPLACFEPLARVPGVRLFSLQKNTGIEQLDALAGGLPATDLGRRLDETTGPFLDTAAVLVNLDLFITSDTAVAHLAGALGVPVWMPLSTTPDWRWMAHREDNPWYPTMRIFRQADHMAWGPVFERMAAELRKLVPNRVRTPAVTVAIAPGELIDKITILEIKAGRIGDPDKLRNVRAELAELCEARECSIFGRDELASLTADLRAVNESLWNIEDEIRNCERDGDFGPKFVELARSVYKENDQRAAIKRKMNELLGSRIVEEKSYPGSGGQGT